MVNQQQLFFAYVGSFTTAKRRGRGEGIEVYAFDAVTGRWKYIQRIAGLINPSWLHLNRDATTLYVGHGDADYVSAFAVDPTSGTLSSLGSAPSGGENVVSCRSIQANAFWLRPILLPAQ